MQGTKEVVKTGKRMGKKVMATDTAQDVVGVVVDGLEDVAVDKADDVAENLKARAARAGGRSPKRASAKKPSTKKPAGKKPTAKRPTAKKKARPRGSPRPRRRPRLRGSQRRRRRPRPRRKPKKESYREEEAHGQESYGKEDACEETDGQEVVCSGQTALIEPSPSAATAALRYPRCMAEEAAVRVRRAQRGDEGEVARFVEASTTTCFPTRQRFLDDERHLLLLGYVGDRPAGFVPPSRSSTRTSRANSS